MGLVISVSSVSVLENHHLIMADQQHIFSTRSFLCQASKSARFPIFLMDMRAVLESMQMAADTRARWEEVLRLARKRMDLAEPRPPQRTLSNANEISEKFGDCCICLQSFADKHAIFKLPHLQDGEPVGDGHPGSTCAREHHMCSSCSYEFIARDEKLCPICRRSVGPPRRCAPTSSLLLSDKKWLCRMCHTVVPNNGWVDHELYHQVDDKHRNLKTVLRDLDAASRGLLDLIDKTQKHCSFFQKEHHCLLMERRCKRKRSENEEDAETARRRLESPPRASSSQLVAGRQASFLVPRPLGARVVSRAHP